MRIEDCLDGAREQACRYRYFDIDHSVTPTKFGQYKRLYTSKLKSRREREKAELDKCVEQNLFVGYAPELCEIQVCIYPVFLVSGQENLRRSSTNILKISFFWVGYFKALCCCGFI